MNLITYTRYTFEISAVFPATSLSKITKELHKDRPVPGINNISESLVLSDSKGQYIRHHCTTSTDHRIRWHCIPGAGYLKLYEWAAENLDRVAQGRQLHVYVWAGTCDLTQKSGRYINLTSYDSREILSHVEQYLTAFTELINASSCLSTFF